eukprot:7171271-Lingulodinium_polyedra.AAC.1
MAWLDITRQNVTFPHTTWRGNITQRSTICYTLHYSALRHATLGGTEPRKATPYPGATQRYV